MFQDIRAIKLILNIISPARLRKSLDGLNALLKDPYSRDSDRFLDEVVKWYNDWEMDINFGDYYHRIPEAWDGFRALQVRFVQIGCAEQSSIEEEVRKEFSIDPHPPIDRLIKAVFRQNMLDMFAHGRVNKNCLGSA